MKNIVFVIVAAFLFTSCLKSGSENTLVCTYDSCALKAPASEISQVQAYLSSHGITAQQHCSGLFYSIDVDGTGATPNICSNVTVTYEGKLTDGSVFDQSTNSRTFNLSQVIPGWRNGLPKIKAGGRIHLYVPPTLGYGSATLQGIPANSILIFRVDLIAVQ